MTKTPTQKFAYVDALRGYAVFGVILMHATGIASASSGLHSLSVAGMYGVQLFYLMSAFTLFYSFHSRHDEPHPISSFFIRRFFRIAPLFYVAIAFYSFYRLPEWSSPVSLKNVLYEGTFIEGVLLSKAGGIVPGGRTVALEFAFYSVLPFLATIITNLRRAIFFFFISISIAIGSQILAGELGVPAHAIERYHWFPDQVPVFALGIILYFLIFDQKKRNPLPWTAAAAVMFCALGALALKRPSILTGALVQPMRHVVVSIGLLCFAWLLAVRRPKWALNSLIRSYGINSFSAYICHWCVINLAAGIFFARIPITKNFGVFLPIVLILTYCLANVTRYLIEDPFIRLGKHLTRSMSLKAQRPSALELAAEKASISGEL